MAFGNKRKKNMTEDGKCKNCGVFIREALNENLPRVCNAITPDEVNNFKIWV